jgi:hypothetical protein
MLKQKYLAYNAAHRVVIEKPPVHLKSSPRNKIPYRCHSKDYGAGRDCFSVNTTEICLEVLSRKDKAEMHRGEEDADQA